MRCHSEWRPHTSSQLWASFRCISEVPLGLGSAAEVESGLEAHIPSRHSLLLQSGNRGRNKNPRAPLTKLTEEKAKI